MKPKTSVSVVAVDDAVEAFALRAVLEWWGVQVTLHLVGEASDLIRILGEGSQITDTVFLMCHGNAEGIILPALIPELEEQQPFHHIMKPGDVAQFARLPNRVVMSTGCMTGSQAFADAFFQAGCRAYIAPVDYPNGDASLFYTLHFCYDWLCRGAPLSEAHEHAAAHDSGTRLFRLFQADA